MHMSGANPFLQRDKLFTVADSYNKDRPRTAIHSNLSTSGRNNVVSINYTQPRIPTWMLFLVVLRPRPTRTYDAAELVRKHLLKDFNGVHNS